MAANRKLQSEIDRTLKKVQEGVEIFDEIWEKVYGAQNQNQKEKFESELKSQIKKLQRYRDDIKTWITNSDIKDKRPLTDARKQIETEMERFKVCEKEFKTKAFSKEGLSQAPKEDPKEKEKNKIRKWISEKLETITSQVDVYEVEIESLASSTKKKKKDNSAQKWEDLIERCRVHEAKLELVLRAVDNDTLSADDVEPIMEQVDYLLEQMVDGNYDEVDSIDDDAIYEELGLDELAAPAEKEEEWAKDAPPAESSAKPVADEKAGAKDKKEEKMSDKDKRKAKEKEEEEARKERRAKEKTTATEVALPSINAAAVKAAVPKASVKEPPAKPTPTKVPAPVVPAAAAATSTAPTARCRPSAPRPRASAGRRVATGRLPTSARPASGRCSSSRRSARGGASCRRASSRRASSSSSMSARSSTARRGRHARRGSGASTTCTS